MPPYSITAHKPILDIQSGKVIVKKNLLENDFLRVEFNTKGDITRILDKKAEREVLPDGALANQWIAYEDRPLNWDAWDIEVFYDDKSWITEPATSIKVLNEGPLVGTLEITRQILSSPYTQRISLNHNSSRLDFETEIDWRDQKVLLKAAFPVDVLAPEATYEIQWGNTKRPTHQNTSWDWARFETAAQKWVDLSEGDYGVSLLNDSKYGHDIHGNTIRLTLLRGTTAPDPRADQGLHQFTYSLYPHQGAWDEGTIREAYSLNDPLILHGQAFIDQDEPEKSISFFSLDQPQLVIETVKAAQDGRGLIVRLYETRRTRGKAILSCGFPIKNVWQTNILEEDRLEITPAGNHLEFSYKPYQIITLRIIPD
jgi:alpha-mannosidase